MAANVNGAYMRRLHSYEELSEDAWERLKAQLSYMGYKVDAIDPVRLYEIALSIAKHNDRDGQLIYLQSPAYSKRIRDVLSDSKK